MVNQISLKICNYLLSIVLIIFTYFSFAHAQQTGSSLRDTLQFNSKQREEVSGGACVIQTGAFSVGFSAYVVPEGDHPSYPAFCSPVPAGPLNLVIDILEPDMRKVPLTVRLLKLEDGRDQEVLSLQAAVYSFGSIAFPVNLEPLAKYKILLTDNGNLVEIPLDVRRKGDFAHTGTGGTGLGSFFFILAIFLALVGGVVHLWSRPGSSSASRNK